MNPERTGAFFERENDLYSATFAGDRAVRLTKTPGKKEFVTFTSKRRFFGQQTRGSTLASARQRPARKTPPPRRLELEGLEERMVLAYTFTSFDVPSGFNTRANSINDAGQIVGYYTGSGTDHDIVEAFLAGHG